jgi:hypothetical protein
MPHKAAREMWYATDMGAVHLVMLNSEQSLAIDSPQYRYGDGASVEAWRAQGCRGSGDMVVRVQGAMAGMV